MKLSILDQSPIASNQSAKDALDESVKLAQKGEEFGYTRYWIAEHHDLSGLASSVPEVMLPLIGAKTKRIRIGPGAVLLPYYRPYKVAETYNMLATLYPERIDIGIGRAPGGSAEATNALSDQFLKQVWAMPDLIKELLHFIYLDFPLDHAYAKLTASPRPETPPKPWLLGTSKKSALLAAELGIAYTFGAFMSDKDGEEIVQMYKDAFQPQQKGDVPQVILTVSAVCGETAEMAEEIALSSLIWSLQKELGKGNGGVPSIAEAKQYPLNAEEKAKVESLKEKMIIGSPKEVKNKLHELQMKFQADEIMIVTITHRPEDRIRSYELIAQEIINEAASK
ncbi:LLM class flavin-dependent oxidoreductase [Niallia nealsonii]|uniref:LLM class flavin-dependent oxidoreductase n=1 Tax=Niallia nealsonii TaxID=115979 RepID=A0A2N0Z522_9BACI|nr:LLM class flavin-dependent oxidoreductase [Niallia nealsonii]PKG24612.1 LLM class flavin-dependent oxidoreductase [Niallia nealsonii]